MKKLLMIAVSAAMVSFSALAQVQDQDTTSTNLNTPVEETQQNQNNTQSDDMKTRDAERADDQPQSTDRQLQEDADAMQENFEGATIDKVGPNGEKLFMDRGKYFYINDEGKKVKVKKSEVRDKSEMQQQP